ncbi:methyl-accepting chemotaxis protein [Shewanella cyperi]|uniref:methyl-accepting chemotaxis protein n=1 Tax=Shewanella cyperi TaxID=2814292 RepID=UPI001A93BB3E|nr:methyl-accepting chemotaxis protein [Shewanella cyperi]QSX39953.1 methyl-accepting chemotaxis protein [Shewanella cyperi]
MLIRQKLLLSATLSVAALVAMLGLQLYAGGQQEELAEAAQQVIELEKDILILRKDEKDFLSRLDLKYVEDHARHGAELQQKLEQVEEKFLEYRMPRSAIDSFEHAIDEYLATFKQVVALQQEIGLTPKTGLYGNLRQAVHDVESLVEEHNRPELLAAMLQLRRNEKDFMLRRDMSYMDKFDSNVAKFNQTLSAAGLEGDVESRIRELMGNYQRDFKALVNKEQAFGLGKEDGAIGKLRAAVSRAEAASTELGQLASAEIAAAKQSAVRWGFVIFGLILVIVAVTTYRIIQSVITPVTRINQVITEIGRNKDLTRRCDESGGDEMAEIAVHFNEMLDIIRKLIDQVVESVAIVNQSCTSLSSNAAAASDGVMRQLNETDMVATAITEMGATIDEIAKNTELAAERAGHTHENAQSGQREVVQTIDKIQSLARQLNESAKVVAELERDSSTIGSVLDVIRGIAEQTNLLALNAAIEAARAGEQGRGFAVVADEVRSLAMRTQESTEEIAGIIQTLQSRTRSIVQLMEASQRQGTESAEQAASAGALLEQINQDVTNIMDMSTQIAAAIEEQSSVAAEVNKNVVIIRDIAEMSSEAAMNNAKASDEVRDRAALLQKAVSQFRT